jgi:hypothetical protein
MFMLPFFIPKGVLEKIIPHFYWQGDEHKNGVD